MSEKQVNPRQAAMAQIAQAAHEKAAVDMAQFDEETGQVLPNANAPAEQPEPEARAEQSVTPEPEVVAEPHQKRIVSLVVDGQKIDVDEERVLEAGKRTLQKESAADKRLAEANELLRRAKAQASRVDPEPAADDQAPSNDVPRDAKTPTVDHAAVFQTVEQMLYVSEAKKAVRKFKQEFPEVASDDYLMAIAAQLEDRRISEATELGESLGDPEEAYRKHGETIRSWIQSKGAKPADKHQEPSSRTEAKRQIVAVPGANVRAAAPADKKPPTVADTIEEMRQKRGRVALVAKS